MERNAGDAPRGSEELPTFLELEEEECVGCQGVVGDASDRPDQDEEAMEPMETNVRIDWSYMQKPQVEGNPVAKMDGSPMRAMWAEPN